jgi:MFS family permease
VPTSDSKTPLLRVIALSMAVLAGYVTVLSTGPVAANVRLSQLTEQSAFWYSVMASSGALVAAITFITFGRISNRLLETRGSRQPIFIGAALALAPAAYLLSVTDSIPTVIALWCFIQIPAAAVLSVATAVVLELVPERLIGIASGLFGAGAILAIFFGIIMGTVFKNDPTPVLFIGLATATLLTIPAAFTKEKTELKLQESQSKTRAPKQFWFFIFATTASFAVSTLSSDYYYQLSLRLLDQDTAAAATLAQSIFAIAALTFLVASVVGGILSKTHKTSLAIFSYSLLISVVGVLAITFTQTTWLLMVGAVVTAIGTGLNVGAQLPVLRLTLPGREEVGREAGIFNLASLIPSIVVPAFAALVIGSTGFDWPITIGSIVAVIAVIGAALARTIRIR